MKKLKTLTAIALTIPLLAGPLAGFAGEEKTAAKPKPYPLKTCVVSGEKLGEMSPPYVFTYKDRQIKLCCKDCLGDFKKDPAKYVKKLEVAEKAQKAKKAKETK